MREVGRCGEPVHGFVRRYPHWFRANLTSEAAKQPFEHDIGDLLGDRCHSMQLVATMSTESAQENIPGYKRTLRLLRERGCHVETVPEPGAHGCFANTFA